MTPVAVVERVFYVQRGKLGFYCDSEWDGDSFCSDPFSAYKRTEPWVEGRGSQAYQCVAVRLTETIYREHLDSSVIPVQCAPRGKKQIRYKCKCSRCGMSTKNYALPETATTRYELERNVNKCVVRTWKYEGATR